VCVYNTTLRTIIDGGGHTNNPPTNLTKPKEAFLFRKNNDDEGERNFLVRPPVFVSEVVRSKWRHCLLHPHHV